MEETNDKEERTKEELADQSDGVDKTDSKSGSLLSSTQSVDITSPKIPLTEELLPVSSQEDETCSGSSSRIADTSDDVGLALESTPTDISSIEQDKNSDIESNTKEVTIKIEVSDEPERPLVEQDGHDADGFLTPPPASTLLIRRDRTGSAGSATYVVSSGSGPSPTSTDVPAALEEEYGMMASPQTKSGKGAFGSRGKDSSVKRRPGRPVGSVGPYKRKKYTSEGPAVGDYSSGEVRVSSRMSTSIFKHDISGAASMSSSHQTQDNSPYIYPTAIRTSQLSGGKPPMAGYRKPYSKSIKKEKDVFDNIDPFTGKRRYRRKKLGDERRETIDDFSGDSELESVEKPIKFHLSDNGIWRPTDDLRLLVNLRATNNLETIYYGVKFSCYFSYRDIEERWKKLLYNEKAALVAQNAIIAIHPNVKAKIYYESLFSLEEETLISTIKVTTDSNPDIKLFQTMLEENTHVFNKHRTPRSLLMHWLDMKDFHLLSNQNALDYNPSQTFEDLEDSVCENIDDSDDEIESESILLELTSEERNLKKKLRLLDDEINAWQAITGQIIEDGMKNNTLPPLPTDFDGKTYALLRGKEVYYGMTSREIILGRSTNECKVDADLTEEGSSVRVSRKQAIIRLKRMGRFVIINKGKRPIFVDKKCVQYRCAAVLHDQSVIQIAQINLIFFINETLIAKVIERDVSGEIYASFKDLDLENETSATPSSKSSLPSTLAAPRHYPLYTNPSMPYGGVQSQFRDGSLVPHSMEGIQLDFTSNTTSNESALGDTDGASSPIFQPPASYVTIL